MPRTCSRPCAFEVNKTKTKNTKSHKTLKKHTTKCIHSSPATATTSRRRAVKHVPFVSPYSHSSSIDPGFVEIGLACIHTYQGMYNILALLLLLRRLCTFWCSILFSGQRSFVVLCCDTRMYLRFRGCPVVLDIELSVSAWYHKTCLLYTSPSPRDLSTSRMPSSA